MFAYLILLHRRGITSYQDPLIVGKVRYETYRESAEHHGLRESEQEYERALHDATLIKKPVALTL